MSRKTILASLLSLVAVALAFNISVQAAPAAGKATGEIVAAANLFLASLDDSQRGKVLFTFNDAEQRKRWSNLPTTMVKRGGLRMGDLSKPQRGAALALLAAALSPQGYEKVLQIVQGDELLRKNDGGGRSMFGENEYYLSLLGRPSTTNAWMIQFRGHHLGLSTNEASAYAESVRRDLVLRLDQRDLPLKLTASDFPAPADLRAGWGTIQMEFSVPAGKLSAGVHKLTLDNRHLPGLSVYLFNAAQPGSSSIQITKQKRTDNQSTGEIEFTIDRPILELGPAKRTKLP